MKHPLERALTGSAYIAEKYPQVNAGDKSNLTQWWEFARDSRHNNIALQRLSAGQTCCQNENTNITHLHTAQALVRRMTFVMDINCLDENLQVFAQMLDFTLNKKKHTAKKVHPPIEERFPNKEIYDFLAERNKRDIEFYEWSKNLSLVKCDDL